MTVAYPYFRVSTERQGQSGLGLEAQQQAVRDYAERHGIELRREFVEIESGRKKKRPILKEVLETCKRDKATLLIAKLDRLARNVAFIATLMESGIDFIAVDNPHASKLVLHIMAAFAEHERDEISKRTIAALAAAKRRGIELGVYGRDVQSRRNIELANVFAYCMSPVLEEFRRNGFHTVREVTRLLNENKIPTFRGDDAKWHPNTVHTLMKRIETLNHEKNTQPII